MKNFVNACLFMLISLILFESTPAHAEMLTIKDKGEYIMGDAEGVDIPTAKKGAFDDAKKNAVEQAGSYLETHTVVADFRLIKDKMESISAAIVKVVEHKYRPVVVDEQTFKWVCDITVLIDTDKISPEKILNRESEKDARIRELEEQLAKAMQNNNANGNSHQLINKYENSIDLYNFDNKINWQEMLETAEKLSSLDPQNPTAFIVTVNSYREQDKIHNVINYCKKMLNSNPSTDLAIECYLQLGDIYYNDIDDVNEARKYVDKAIALVKKEYTQKEIDMLVNGTNVKVVDFVLIGKSNTIRELYILKSDIEDESPTFAAETVVEMMITTSDVIGNIKYRTNW